MFKKFFFILFIFVIGTFFILIQLGNLQPPKTSSQPLSSEQIQQKSQFFAKKEYGLNNIVLQGSAFERGQQFGYFTQKLLVMQEQQLMDKFTEIFPYRLSHYFISLFSMGWFYGLSDLFDREWVDEMYGVSLYVQKKKIYFASPYTRQIAYHALHGIGQMMVDSNIVLGGCTQLAIKKKNSWFIGRNFDFEAGSIFDEEKIIKWVFPTHGIPFVSVSFAGMVGVVTGVNRAGVYIAINAAGTDHFTRIGKPSSLIALKALQYAQSAREAVTIIEEEHSLISNIFVVADLKKNLFVVEKSPKKVRVREALHSTTVTNHFLHQGWSSDQTNQKRMAEQTTVTRYNRGLDLIKETQENPIMQLLQSLRDKSVQGKKRLGHRGAIDALIASHSTIYDTEKSIFYVSEGPSLTRAFHGYDLKSSFAQKKPVKINSLPPDPDLTSDDYSDIKRSLSMTSSLIQNIRSGNCHNANETLRLIDKDPIFNHYLYATAVGDTWKCKNNLIEAKKNWQRALHLQPARLRETKELEERIHATSTSHSFTDWLSNDAKD